MLAVTLGLLSSRRLGLALPAEAVEGALAKIERVLPEAVRERVQAVAATVALDLPAGPGGAESRLLAELSAAAARGRSLRLRYGALSGDETVRVVDPYGVAWRAAPAPGTWWATVTCAPTCAPSASTGS